MDTKISLQENTYGVLAIPDDWVAFMNAFMKVEAGKQPELFFSGLFLTLISLLVGSLMLKTIKIFFQNVLRMEMGIQRVIGISNM